MVFEVFFFLLAVGLLAMVAGELSVTAAVMCGLARWLVVLRRILSVAVFGCLLAACACGFYIAVFVLVMRGLDNETQPFILAMGLSMLVGFASYALLVGAIKETAGSVPVGDDAQRFPRYW